MGRALAGFRPVADLSFFYTAHNRRAESAPVALQTHLLASLFSVFGVYELDSGQK